MTPGRPFNTSSAQIERAEQVAGLTLLECQYSPDLLMPQHWHDYAHFVLVLGGACTDTCRKDSRRYGPSHLVFYPAGEPHASHFHRPGTQTFEIQIQTEWLERVSGFSIRGEEPCDFTAGWPVWLGRRIYNEFREMDAMAALAIQGLALELLAETARRWSNASERTPPRWLRQTRELLQAQFTESLSLDEIAAVAGVHPVHLARTFRQHYRCTVGEYLRHLRLERARHALCTSDAPVTEIAAASGFADQSHLSNLFKRHTGITPTEFRKRFGLR
jgi:AraC family transcriptional regulator